MNPSCLPYSWALAAVIISAGCAPSLIAADPQDDASLFDPNHLLHIELQLSPENWHDLRISHRVKTETTSLSDKPYDYYRADVIIDGVKTASVGVRKKGFLGSAVSTRPSLKIKFDEYVKNQEFRGLEMMTLNANNQDPTCANQMLVYSFFHEAGVMAPRCGLAHLVVNGEDLGVYSHVESIGKPFFKRHFKDSKGDLYEGYAGDFTPREATNIVHKWGSDNNRANPAKLVDLLESPAPISIAQFEELLDLNSFIKVWAAECLVGHADSYSGNRNNWYAYWHRETGRFYFVPWGADAAFRDPSPYIRYPVPASVKAKGYLCERLWELQEVRERYRKEMQRLLDEVWHEGPMLAELDRIIRLSSAHPGFEQDMVDLVASNIRSFVGRRRQDVQAELSGPAPEWPPLPRSRGSAFQPREMIITGAFDTSMRAEPSLLTSPSSILDPFGDPPESVLGTGTATIRYEIEGDPHSPFMRYGAVAMPDRRGYRKGYPVIQIVAEDQAGEFLWNLRFTLDPHQVQEGTNTLPVDMFTAQASLSQRHPGSADEKHSPIRVFGNLQLEAFGMKSGARVKGTFTLTTQAFD